MADDTKLILRELEKINQRMSDMHDELNGRINDLDGKVNAIHDDLNGKMDGIHDDLNGKIIDLQKTNTKIQVSIKNDIIKVIDVIGNRHGSLQKRVNALMMKENWVGMELEQIKQRMELRKLKDHMGIS